MSDSQKSYKFGRFRIEVSANEARLFLDDRKARLSKPGISVLLALVENRPKPISWDELLKAGWPSEMPPYSLYYKNRVWQTVNKIRTVLGDDPNDPTYIKTEDGRYSFIGHVDSEVDAQTAILPPTAPSTEEPQEIPEAGETSQSAAFPLSESAHAARPQLPKLLVAGVISILLLATAIGLILFFQRASNLPFTTRSIVKITGSGTIKEGIVSPDGNFIFYLADDSGKIAIRRREILTGSDLEIDGCSTCKNLAVSPDGRYLYMLIKHDSLVRLPLQEERSPAEPLLKSVHSPIAFSPNGAQFAFVRYLENDEKRALMIANSDGSGVRELAITKSPELLGLDGPTWSHDGKSIASSLRTLTPSAYYFQVVCFDVQNGKEIYRSNDWQWLEQIAWLPDDSGFVLIGRERHVPGTNNQVYLLTYPSWLLRALGLTGQFHNVTHDLNNYRGVSISGPPVILATSEANTKSDIWTVDLNRPDEGKQITFGGGFYRALSWTSENNLVFIAYTGGTSHVLSMNVNGSGKTQITKGGGADASSVSPDGRYIVFQSNVSGAPSVWRMDFDGSNPKQLAERGTYPRCSPDGKWVVYTSLGSQVDDKRTLWRVSIDGGLPVQLSDLYLNDAAISPDGKWIASNHWNEKSSYSIVFVPFEGGPPKMVLKADSEDTEIRWTPDGQALAFVRTEKGVSNVWVASLSGKDPHRLTNFESDRIFSFDFSPDGKQLVLSRGASAADVVLIKDNP